MATKEVWVDMPRNRYGSVDEGLGDSFVASDTETDTEDSINQDNAFVDNNQSQGLEDLSVCSKVKGQDVKVKPQDHHVKVKSEVDAQGMDEAFLGDEFITEEFAIDNTLVAHSNPVDISIIEKQTSIRKSNDWGQLKIFLSVRKGILDAQIKEARYLSSETCYICVSLQPSTDRRTHCRTATAHVKNSSHKFSDNFNIKLQTGDEDRRVLISVWTKDKNKLSQFLGCMSFGISKLLAGSNVEGWYYLLTEKTGRYKHRPVSSRSRESQHKPTNMAERSTEQEGSWSTIIEHVSEIFPEKNDVTNLTDVNDITNFSEGNDITNLSEVNDITSLSEVNDITSLSEVNDITSLSEVNDITNLSGVSEDSMWADNLKVVIERGRHGYGFTLLGSSPVKVGRVERRSPGSAAGLKENDQIISINGCEVLGSTAEEVAKIVKQSAKQIVLVIYRPVEVMTSSDLGQCSEVISQTGLYPSLDDKASHSPGQLKQRQPIRKSDEKTQQPITARHGSLSEKGESLQEVLSQQESWIGIDGRLSTKSTCTREPQFPLSYQDLSSMEVQRQDAIQKLLRLTEDYVQQMSLGIQGYSRPLRHGVISPAKHNALFQNIEKLAMLSDNILHLLSEISVAYYDLDNTTDRYIHQTTNRYIHLIGGIFKPKLSVMADSYEAYCTGVQSSFTLLRELTDIPEFEKFTQIAMLEDQQPTITSFLQGPLRYIKDLLSLLQQIVVCTPRWHQDYQDLAFVIDTLRNACYIDY